MRWLKTKGSNWLLALLLIVAPVLITKSTASAAYLNDRFVRIGTSTAGATTTHDYSFTIPTASNLGSIAFEYCSNDPFINAPCVPPSGLSLSSVMLSAQTGETGFSIHAASTVNKIIITRLPSPNLAFQPVTYSFNNAINPTTNNVPTYVRITTYPTNDASGPNSDEGAVVFAVTRSVTVKGYVPPYLTFCAGITISNKCTSIAGNFINLGELSKTNENYSTSQFGGTTNDPGGYSVFLAGNTMASGTNTISPLAAQEFSFPGSSQFGINLVANSNPAVGQNLIGSGTATALSGYNQSNRFKLKNEPIAASPFSTNFNTFTVSYLVNVSASQKPGIYSTTLTYIATAAF